jgi:hypothetical protein
MTFVRFVAQLRFQFLNYAFMDSPGRNEGERRPAACWEKPD